MKLGARATTSEHSGSRDRMRNKSLRRPAAKFTQMAGLQKLDLEPEPAGHVSRGDGPIEQLEIAERPNGARKVVRTCGPVALTGPMLIGVSVGAAALATIIILASVLTLPETYSCYPEDTKYFVIKVDAPELSIVEPPMVCTTYASKQVFVGGSAFLQFGSLIPDVRWNGTSIPYLNSSICPPVKLRNSQKLTGCQEFHTIIPQSNTTEIVFPWLKLTQPAPAKPHPAATTPTRDADTCCVNNDQLLALIPAPRIHDLYPVVVCTTSTYDISVSGEILLEARKTVLNLSLPAVQIVGQPFGELVKDVSQCVTVNVSNYASVRSCNELDFYLDTSTLPIAASDLTALYSFSVTNPSPADCISTDSLELRMVRPPTVTAASPYMVCLDDEDRLIQLQGTNFVWVDGLAPVVSIGSYMVTIASSSPTVSNMAVDGCTSLPVKGHVVWSCTSLWVKLSQTPGIDIAYPSVHVNHPNLGGCGATFDKLLAVVPAPTQSKLSPPIVCQADSIDMMVEGTFFINFTSSLLNFQGEKKVDPTVLEVAGQVPVIMSIPQTCSWFNVDVYGAVNNCSEMTVQLNTSLIPADYALRQLRLQNGYPVNCSADVNSDFRVVPFPRVDSSSPDILCSATSTLLALNGSDFIWVDGMPPIIRVNGTEVNVTGSDMDPACAMNYSLRGHVIRACSLLTIDIAPVLQDSPYPELATLDVEISFRGSPQCARVYTVQVVIVSEPKLTTLQPTLCDGSFPQFLNVTGSSFIVIDNGVVTFPTFTFNDTNVPSTLSDCGPTISFRGQQIYGCTFATITVASAGPSNWLAMMNPAPVSCSSQLANYIAVVPPQSIVNATPSVVCAASNAATTTTVLLEGSFVNYVNPPPVYVVGNSLVLSASFPASATCVTTNLTTLVYMVCDQIEVVVPADLLAAPGGVQLEVGGACAGVRVLMFAMPTSSITLASPPLMCEITPHTVTLYGSDFVSTVDGPMKTEPTAVITDSNGTLFQGLSVANYGGSPTNCPNITFGDGTVLYRCPSLNFDFNPATQHWSPGVVTIVVDNSAQAGCGVPNNQVMEIIPIPAVNSIGPSKWCQDQGATVSVYGKYFDSRWTNATVYDPIFSIERYPISTTVISSTQLDMYFAPNQMVATLYDVRVKNPDGCETDLLAVMDVHPRLLVLFVDPPVLYNGISMQLQIFATGLKSQVKYVDIVNGSSGVILQRFTANETTFPVGNPNRINVIVSKGFPVGIWDIQITSEIGCVNYASKLLNVVSTVGVNITNANPRFVWVNATATALTVTSPLSGLPAGYENFRNSPRMYLSPTNASGLSIGQPLASVGFDSPYSVTAVLRQGLPIGWYDLVVVNPVSFKIGYLTKAVAILKTQPPTIEAVNPSNIPTSIANQGGITILGADFSTTLGNYVTLDCAGTLYPQRAGSPIPAFTTSTLLIQGTDISLPGTGACIVVVTRVDVASALQSDCPSVRFSLVSISNPASKFNPFSQTTELLVQPRRGHVLLDGSVGNKYLWAIGGDNGTAGTVNGLQSVECSKLDQYGTPGAWRTVRTPLPQPVAFASGITIGQYLYIVGGRNRATGSDQVLNTVYRAQLLNPSQTPNIGVDLSVVLGEPTVFSEGGAYTYVVSALFPNTWLANPGGESLPGEAISFELPKIQIPNQNVTVTLKLTWDEIPGATHYKIYRTSVAGLTSADVKLLRTVDINSYEDDGSFNYTMPNSTSPLKEGDLGNWATLPNINVGRFGLGVTYLDHPTMTNRYFLYALQGSNASNIARLDYEVLTIDVIPSAALVAAELQNVSVTWASSSSAACLGCITNFGTRRVFTSAIRVDSSSMTTWGNHSGKTALIMGVGGSYDGTTFTTTPNGEAVTVNGTTGFLYNLQSAAIASTGTEGSCTFASAGQLNIFAGRNPGSYSVSMLIGQGFAVNDVNNGFSKLYTLGTNLPPSINLLSGGTSVGGNPNSNAGNVPQLAYPGCAQAVSHVFISGGQDTTSGALSTQVWTAIL